MTSTSAEIIAGKRLSPRPKITVCGLFEALLKRVVEGMPKGKAATSVSVLQDAP